LTPQENSSGNGDNTAFLSMPRKIAGSIQKLTFLEELAKQQA